MRGNGGEGKEGREGGKKRGKGVVGYVFVMDFVLHTLRRQRKREEKTLLYTSNPFYLIANRVDCVHMVRRKGERRGRGEGGKVSFPLSLLLHLFQ